MAETPSTRILKIGEAVPGFKLPDPAGSMASFDERDGLPALVMFVCNHCPFVVHLAAGIRELAEEYHGRVAFYAINSNDVENYPADSPEKMAEFSREHDWAFPYLYDEDQSVAKAWAAACTPDFFLTDADGRLVYCGQFDDSRPARWAKTEAEVTGDDIRDAIERVLNGDPPRETQRLSTGCNIKWKPGNEPSYFG